MDLAIVSDTHVPGRATGIPEWVKDRVRAADHTIHAGDFDSEATLDAVRTLADGSLTAVSGNIDPPLGLPRVAVVEFEGVTFCVTHGTGSHDGYEARVAGIVREEAGTDAVGVGGHTHSYLDTEVDGVRLLNPGSATGAKPATETTMLTATVDSGDLAVEVHRE